MREIKFRAWSKKDKTMYRVVLIDFIEKMIADNDEYFWDFDEVELMQYTGLNDATKWEQLSEQEKHNFYNQNCSDDGRTIKYQHNEDGRVIGNIYENPELLGGGSK